MMKRYLNSFVLVLLFTSLFAQTVFAQVDMRNITFEGRVHDTKGKGIANVAVTDGYNIVKTDAEGKYSLLSTATAEYVYISIPAGYEIPMDNDAPLFFQKASESYQAVQKFNFELKKMKRSDDKHVMLVWADPQVYYSDELPELQEAVDDVKQLIARNYKKTPVFGLVAGDMIGWIKDADEIYPPLKKMIASTGVPFFYAVGNHDMDASSRSDYKSKVTYKKYFGPNYYSFNRGKVHYVVLDDVFYTARNNASIGYIDEPQLNWLIQDLKDVPAGSTVAITLHIPTYSPEARRGEVAKEQMHRVLQNREALYKILEPYNAHIFSAHEHYVENYVIKDNIFEHVHTTLSGLFWMAPWSWDGSPRGYMVYEVDGDDIKWYSKSVGKDKNHQFNAYPVGANNQRPNAITANVWNYDPAWKVYWYEDGVKMGEMEQFTGYDTSIARFVDENQSGFKHKGIGAAPTEHLFFAVPKSAASKIRVEVVDRFGNVYTQDVK